MISIRRRKSTEGEIQHDGCGAEAGIFGVVFENTLNPTMRRSGGMHYTSIENIHKVIDPLSLDGLKKELEKIKEIQIQKERQKMLKEFQKKLGVLVFLEIKVQSLIQFSDSLAA